jgi:hypothetical protein
MRRRTFLRRLIAGVVGLTLARELPGIAAAPPTPGRIVVRTIVRFDVGRNVMRYDVLYGVGVINEKLAARVMA